MYDTNFDAPDARFDYLSTQAEKVGNPKKNCDNYIRAEKTQILSHEI
jgi:hypothetical protein